MENYDKIIVPTNNQMDKIIKWYKLNTWVDNEEFKPPFKSGIIELKEELTKIVFKSVDENKVNFILYFDGNNKAIEFDYIPALKIIDTNSIKYPDVAAENKIIIQMMIATNRIKENSVLKYHALMKFAVYYKEIVKIDKLQTKVITANKIKKKRRNIKSIPLIQKTYIVQNVDDSIIHSTGTEKRKYTKPTYEVTVRGYRRKNGTWVNEYTKYKNKSTGHRKIYSIPNIETEDL